MALSRWLLLLGSNLEHEQRVRDALTALAALGPLECLTLIRRLAADHEHGGSFYNVLVSLDNVDTDRDRLDTQLKRIEAQLGRRRDDPEAVAIDIDILAHHDGTRWQPDPHAQAKGEFTRAPVLAMLHEAGIKIAAFNTQAGPEHSPQ